MTAVTRAMCLLFGTALLWGAAPNITHAEDDAPRAAERARRAKGRTKAKPKVARKKRERAREVASQPNAPSERAVPSKSREAAPVPSSTAAAQAAAANADSEIVKEGDTSVKVMKFTGLGIEGRLKSPQLVYFVQRVRAEFHRPELPHRSFMPELEQSAAREPVR